MCGMPKLSRRIVTSAASASGGRMTVARWQARVTPAARAQTSARLRGEAGDMTAQCNARVAALFPASCGCGSKIGPMTSTAAALPPDLQKLLSEIEDADRVAESLSAGLSEHQFHWQP